MTMEDADELSAKARASALASLAMREHSTLELRDKLLRKNMPEQVVSKLILQLHKDNLLSDARFAEVYWRQRAARGFGPIKIAYELQNKGVDETTIENGQQHAEVDFSETIKAVYIKKYGNAAYQDFTEKVKRQNFLYRRGFPVELIKDVID